MKRITIMVAILICSLAAFIASKHTKQDHRITSSHGDMIVNTKDRVTPHASAKKPKSLIPETKTANEVEKPIQWLSVKIQPGDNLSRIFKRQNLSTKILNEIILIDRKNKILPRLRPGQSIKFGQHNGEIISIVLEIDALSSVWFEREGESLISRIESVEPTLRLATASATITRSLYLDGLEAGLSDSIIMQLTEIFAWDIDFALDLRQGDSFSVIYEKIYKGSKLLGARKILAAEFINRGNIKRAARYPLVGDKGDYFNPDGDAMKKAFLRTPVDFSRISSRFSLKRKHPILSKIRAHTGVDYAASLGTPIRATSDGRVKSIGWNGGYGKTIVLSHGNRYSTLYAHLARYNRKIKPGTNVKQGQIIGYVGKTGLATGPHLHYEFRLDGKHKDPLTVEFPPAQPIATILYDDFTNLTTPFFKHLELLASDNSETELASRPKDREKTEKRYQSPNFVN